jgi:hypothetical protein
MYILVLHALDLMLVCPCLAKHVQGPVSPEVLEQDLLIFAYVTGGRWRACGGDEGHCVIASPCDVSERWELPLANLKAQHPHPSKPSCSKQKK